MPKIDDRLERTLNVESAYNTIVKHLAETKTIFYLDRAGNNTTAGKWFFFVFIPETVDGITRTVQYNLTPAIYHLLNDGKPVDSATFKGIQTNGGGADDAAIPALVRCVGSQGVKDIQFRNLL